MPEPPPRSIPPRPRRRRSASASPPSAARCRAIAAPPPAAPTLAVPASKLPWTLVPHAGAWQVTVTTRQFLLPNLRGMAMLARLAATPHVEVHSLELVSGAAAPADRGDAGERTSTRAGARGLPQARVGELDDAREDAEARGDARRRRRDRARAHRDRQGAVARGGHRRQGAKGRSGRRASAHRVRSADCARRSRRSRRSTPSWAVTSTPRSAPVRSAPIGRSQQCIRYVYLTDGRCGIRALRVYNVSTMTIVGRS